MTLDNMNVKLLQYLNIIAFFFLFFFVTTFANFTDRSKIISLVPCNCNGYSNRCFFDKKLYEESGHGGHCLDCAENRDGPNCERCRDNYYLSNNSRCLPCECNEIGSRSLECNSEGKCDCKPGVTGEKCDRCALDYYDFSSTGCKACNCLVAGSFDNQPSCDQTIGKCICKENVEGKECGRCKPGHFNLDEENEFGCTPCFCYGHSSVCDTAAEYSKVVVESMFARNREKWNAMDKNFVNSEIEYNPKTQTIGVTSLGRDPVYFVAPERFLGDQRASYNQDFEFRLRLSENGPAASVEDIILESNKLRVSQTIIGQGNESPSTAETTYKFRVHEHPDFGWEPRITSKDFMSILSNLTAIRIRGTYTPRGAGWLDDVKLGTARRGAAGQPAKWIEWCECPVGYVGQFCESCGPGYRHDPPYGGPFATCIPCNCYNHSDICDPDTGRCICQHNTAGENCERCARGYYGNAIAGTESDCHECPCPNQGACYQLPESETVICLECPKGYAGARCDQCSDGYYGDVDVISGSSRMCKPCDCNGNVDLNAVNNCDRVTGECLKCIYNTGGPHCDQCLPGYYGDALAIPKGDCKPCRCDPTGTESSGEGPLLCDQITGQCQCKPNVTGINCDQCKPGYFNIDSGKGCEPCRCNVIGSLGHTCDLVTGQCECRPGVARLQCDMCQENYFGFSEDGCQACECDSIGSVSQQCNSTGWCPCLENVEGKHCDRCKENKYDKQRNCVDCPPCYSLVQNDVNKHRENLEKLNLLLENIVASPTILDDEDFDKQVKEVEDRLLKLWEDTKKNIGDDSLLSENLKGLKNKLDNMTETLNKINADTNETEKIVDNAGKNASAIHHTIEQAKKEIQDALDYLNTDGKEALQKASERAAEFGQQNQQMSDIADEARKIVAKHLKQSEEMKQAAEKALETCDEAYKLSLDAREKQENASRELEQLETKIAEAEDNLKKTSELADVVLNETTKAYQESLQFAIEIENLADPKIDPASIKSQAITAQQEARNLQKEIDKINNNFLLETEGLDKKINDSYHKLNQGRQLQQEADALLAEADAAHKRAEKAVEIGTQTLHEAEDTLATLQDFDKKIQAGKQQALEALSTIPNIKALLQDANEKTKNAEEALHGAEINAHNASTTAQSVHNEIASLASKQAQEIRKKTEKTKQQAADLADQVDKLSLAVTEVQANLEEMEERAKEDMEFTKQAKDKVGQAKTNADEATKQVDDALQTLNNIMKELSDLSDIDEDTLEQLENKLNLTEQQFKNANLDHQLELLTTARLKQQQQLKNYEEELARLTIEVEKVQNINDALPSGCWKRNRLEP
ncbi:laminin subunit gamma-1 isoform X2 [Rhodnius prolixus]|uniref:laminin subunit gamma-1 isoform X2 n=1 Tax=Rhodnius prolixus TaxID=13249 RepID=UPI003D187E19